MNEKSKAYVVKSRYQVTFFLVSCCLLSFIFYKPFITFYGFDRLPEVKPFSDQIKPETPIVHVGLLLNNFNEFKIASGEFTFTGSIWFQYDPQRISLEEIKKFHIKYGEIKSISEPDIRKVGDSDIAQFEFTASFTNRLNYAAFPLDDHYISIGIFNYSLPDDMILRSGSTDFDLDDAFHVSGWKLISRKIKVGYIDRLFGKRDLHQTKEAQAFFILQFKRTDPVMLVTILLSLMLIILVSLLPFSIDGYSGDLISGALGGIVAFRFVLAALKPDPVGYFMISDYLFILSLIAIIAAVLSCIAARQLRWSERPQVVMVVGIYAFFVIGSFISLFLI